MSQANFPSNHQLIVDRFLVACQADARSDLELYLITTDEAYAEFLTNVTFDKRLVLTPFYPSHQHSYFPFHLAAIPADSAV